jgi:hypothetical protein
MLNRRIDAQTQLQGRMERLETAEARLQRQIEDNKLKKATGVAEPPDVQRTAIESRKKKERQRETQRKARRAAEQELASFQRVDASPDNAETGSPATELSDGDIMFGDGTSDQAGRDLGLMSTEGCTMEVEHAAVADDVGSELATLLRGAAKAVNKLIDTKPPAKDEIPSDPGLNSVPSKPDCRSMFLGEAAKSSAKLSKGLSAHVHAHTRQGVASSKPKSISFGPLKSSAPILITKSSRHKDWLKFASSTKVDKVSKPLFTSDHPAYKDSVADCWWMCECPFQVSGTLDCPYHKSYCKCADPTNPNTSQYIIYPESHPCQIGPFNYMRGEKLMQFFESQPDTKGTFMLIDEDLYTWVYTVGRHWRIDTITIKNLDNTPMPKRLSWEVERHKRGYPKGRILKQVDQFQDLANRNERLGAIGCRSKITQGLLERLRDKCETGSEDEAICYCRSNRHKHPGDDDDLVECMYVDCPVQFFHRRCVDKLGYKQVSTWYCVSCERAMSVAAQKALHGAHAMAVGLPAPDFESGAYEGPLHFVAQGVDAVLTGHCEGS